MLSLLDSIRAAFSRELVNHVAARMGESENGITKALGGIVPMVLCGLINKAASCESEEMFVLSERAYQLANGRVGSLTGILGMLGGGTYSGSALRQGEHLLSTLFGTWEGSVAAPVSAFAGIRPESAMVLLRMVGAVLPAMLGQYAAHQRLNAYGFMTTLLSLKSQARTLLPAGLRGLTGLLWLGGLGATAPRATFLAVALPPGWPAGRAMSSFGWRRWGQVVAVLVGLLAMLCLLVGPRSGTADTAAWEPAKGSSPQTTTSEVNNMAF